MVKRPALSSAASPEATRLNTCPAIVSPNPSALPKIEMREPGATVVLTEFIVWARTAELSEMQPSSANILHRMVLFSQIIAGINAFPEQLTSCLLFFRPDLGQGSPDFRILTPIEVGRQFRF